MSSDDATGPDTRQTLATQKEAKLDPLLASMIITKAIVHDGILEKPKYDAIHGRLSMSLRNLVDDSIIDVMMSETTSSTEMALPQTPPKWETALTTHQKLDEVLKELIIAAHGHTASRNFVRKKLTLCRLSVVALINSSDFYEIIRSNASSEKLQVKKHRAPRRFNMAAIRRAAGLKK